MAIVLGLFFAIELLIAVLGRAPPRGALGGAGMDEARAAGCVHAAVLHFDDPGAPDAGRVLMVSCSGAEAPDCGRLAKVYAAAASPAAPFYVSVSRDAGPACTARYSETGEFLDAVVR